MGSEAERIVKILLEAKLESTKQVCWFGGPDESLPV